MNDSPAAGSPTRRSVVLGAAWTVPAVISATAAPAFAASCVGGSPTVQNFAPGISTITIPASACRDVDFTLRGGQGGGNVGFGGSAANVSGTLSLPPGAITLTIVVGTGGLWTPNDVGPVAGGVGYGNGGQVPVHTHPAYATSVGSGGAGSAITFGNLSTSNNRPIVVAGGGGGQGWGSFVSETPSDGTNKVIRYGFGGAYDAGGLFDWNGSGPGVGGTNQFDIRQDGNNRLRIDTLGGRPGSGGTGGAIPAFSGITTFGSWGGTQTAFGMWQPAETGGSWSAASGTGAAGGRPPNGFGGAFAVPSPSNVNASPASSFGTTPGIMTLPSGPGLPSGGAGGGGYGGGAGGTNAVLQRWDGTYNIQASGGAGGGAGGSYFGGASGVGVLTYRYLAPVWQQGNGADGAASITYYT